jgi:uncharacterized protein (AIM24 family)
MRSDLFGTHLETTATAGITIQNAHMVRAAVSGELMARQGSMVAYQGDIDFRYQGNGIGRRIKSAVTGEGLPLMRCVGQGDVFLAHNAQEVHLVDLDGDSLTVNGDNVLAFEPGVDWDIHMLDGATSLAAGGLFNTVFTGHGRVAILCHGTPVVLTVDIPTYVDLASAVAWSSSLDTSLRRTARIGALIGRGSGEALQIGFSGFGFVVVQASEGPHVAAHDHPG